MSLNAKYLLLLAQYPLLTKSVTAGVLAAINELVATAVSGQYNKTTVTLFGKKYTFSHVLSTKTLLLVIYGALIATPISHVLYKVLNRVYSGKLSPLMKVAQLATSLLTISPTLSAVFVSWLSMINGYRKTSNSLGKELGKIRLVVREGMRKSFWGIYRSAATTSLLSLIFAQNFLPPELWVVFLTFVFFVLGTIQNTKFKLSQRKLEKKKDE